MTRRTTDYEFIAEDYASARRLHLARHGDVVRPFIEATLVRGGVTLDAGCGSGDDLPILCDLSRSVVGLDCSQAMLRLAAGFPGHGADLVLGDVSALPFPNCTFDSILSRFVLQYLGNPDRAYREFARTLRVGGRLILLIPHPSIAGDKISQAESVPVEVELFDGALKVTYKVRPLHHYLSQCFEKLFEIEAMEYFYLDPASATPSAVGVSATRRTKS